MDDITKYIVERDEINNILNSLQELSIAGDPIFGTTTINLNKADKTVASIALAAAIIYAGYRAVKGAEKFAQSKVCRQYKAGSTPARICENKVLIEKLNKQIQIMKSKINLCKHARNPQKCKAKVNKKIAELDHQLSQRQARIKELESKREGY